MNRIAAPLIMLVVLVLFIAGGTFYQVDETEQVVIEVSDAQSLAA